MSPELEKKYQIEGQRDSDSSTAHSTLPDVALSAPPEQDSEGRESDGAAVAAVPENEPVYITGWALFSVMCSVCLASFTMLLDTSIIATAIPKITSDFHALNDIGWYGASYMLTNATLQPLTGKIYSYFSSKWSFFSFLIVFEIGSLIAALSNSSNMFIVGRAVSGMGSAGIMNGGMTILATCIPIHKRAMYLGIMMSIAQMGILIGPLLGGAFTEYTTWRWCFWINLPIGGLVAGVLAVFVRVPDSQSRTPLPTQMTIKSTFRLFDLFGFVLFAPTIIIFLLALQWGGTTHPWNSAKIIGLFCGSAGGLVVFLFWEHRQGSDAMFPFALIKRRVVYSAMILQMFLSGSMMTCSYYIAIYFQAVKGKTPMMSGVYVLPQILSQSFAAVGSGVLVSRLGYYLPWSVASGALTTIASGLFSTFNISTPAEKWIGYQILAGVGRGCGLQMPIVAVQNSINPAEIPLGNTLLVFSQNFGGAIFLSLAETTFSSALAGALRKYAPSMSVKEILDLGATGFRSTITDKTLVMGVIRSYTVGVQDTFYLATGAAFISFVCAWGLGWKSVKKVKIADDAEVGAEKGKEKVREAMKEQSKEVEV